MTDTPERLPYLAVDVDNHYYEPVDAFTRHLPKEFRSRGVQMVQDGKRTLAVMGGTVNHFIPNPTFDPIIEPGCLDLLFRGEIPEGVDPASLMKVDRLSEHPEYQNRDARVKVLDRQRLETVFMLPTFACGVEEGLKHDIEATMASVHAFNLWLDEDWGFDRPDGRFVSAPIISLADPAKAVEEVEFVISRGAKLVCVRPAPVPGAVRPRSLGDPLHDPVWARLAEAGIAVVFHLSDSGYMAVPALWGGSGVFKGFGKRDPLDMVIMDDRAIHDTMASMIVHQVFTRTKEGNSLQRRRFVMRYKLLGKSGLRVSELCLGTMTFGDDWGWGAGIDESRKIYDAFVEAGSQFSSIPPTFTQTEPASVFWGSLSLRIVTGSCWRRIYQRHGGQSSPNAAATSRKNMMQSVEASLKRLKTDYIDLYWLHVWDFGRLKRSCGPLTI